MSVASIQARRFKQTAGVTRKHVYSSPGKYLEKP